MTSSTPPTRTNDDGGALPGPALTLEDLAAQIQELTAAGAQNDRFLRKLRDDAMIVSRVDGAPRLPFPSVFKSPNGLKKYHLIRVPGGNAEFHELTKEDPAPHESDWDDFGLSSAYAAYLAFFNGTLVEPMDATVSESGGVVTLSVEQTGGGDLTMTFNEGLSTFDCTPAATIQLTVGSDSAPQTNYIYIPQSTKVLTKSTTAWPSGEHIKVAFIHVPSAALVASDGIYVNQNWNDYASNTDNQGHLSHITERIRRIGAQWFSGVDGAGTSGYLTLGGTTVDLKSGAGVIYQLHAHSFPAFDTSVSDTAHVINWNGDAFHEVSNLFDIVADSAGASVVNRWFNIVIWGTANKTGEPEHLMINLPSGSYPTQKAAEQDASHFDDFSMPRAFAIDSSVGFLVARLTVRATGSAWTLGSTTDLRGNTPTIASGLGHPQTIFGDDEFELFDNGDDTKRMVFQLSGITTGTQRVLTVPDADGEIALLGASGTGSILSGNTSIAVSHGLSYTPTIDQIMITFGEQGANDYGRWWVDTIGASQFTVRVSADPGASNLDFGWRVFA